MWHILSFFPQQPLHKMLQFFFLSGLFLICFLLVSLNHLLNPGIPIWLLIGCFTSLLLHRFLFLICWCLLIISWTLGYLSSFWLAVLLYCVRWLLYRFLVCYCFIYYLTAIAYQFPTHFIGLTILYWCIFPFFSDSHQPKNSLGIACISVW